MKKCLDVFNKFKNVFTPDHKVLINLTTELNKYTKIIEINKINKIIEG